MKTIAEHWREFEQMVLPPMASTIQRREMRRAFYAGFQSCLSAAIEIGTTSDGDDKQGAEMLQRLQDECQQFVAAVLDGQA
jgi:hypothetical protein